MLLNSIRLVGAAASVALLSGCASFLPYEDDFACKNDDHGKCIHPEAAYREAVAATSPDVGSGEVEVSTKRRVKAGQKNRQGPDLVLASGGYEGYQDAIYDQLSVMIDEPVTPMVAPAKTVRTLILPYADENAQGRLYMPRYVFSLLEGPKFVLGDYLMNGERDLAGTIAQGMFKGPGAGVTTPVKSEDTDPEALLRSALQGAGLE